MNDEWTITDDGRTIYDKVSGRKYHVSVFRNVLESAAREAYRLGRMDEDGAVRAAIERAYQP
ncbi:MAG TPA: hypothetical protein PKA50_16545 [Gemmatimonadales bacterium]|nr:hypothetical protein [Gemmatimonadales bacterium]